MRGCARLVLLVVFAFTGCLPCDCEEATLLSPKLPDGAVLKISFDDSVLPWSDDTFRVTIIRGTAVTEAEGTYDEDGDSVRFDLKRGEPFLSIESGEINGLSCNKNRGEFTVTPPTAPGVPPLTLTFKCTKTG